MNAAHARTRDVIRQACSDRGLPMVFSDESRDQFDRDGALLTVDYKANGDIRKALYQANGSTGMKLADTEGRP
jgi:hypothetical protein